MGSSTRTTLAATLLTCAVVVPAAMAQDKAAGATQTATLAPADVSALAVIATVDKDEIAAANLALSRKMGKGADDYAHMMVTDHQANLTQTKKLKSYQGMLNDPAADQARKDDQAMMAKLQPLAGKAFEKAYIDDMVAGHTKVLGKIDDDLLPKASDAQVKAHLRKTREGVAKHLEAAKALQSKG